MDLVRICSKVMGEAIANINEEDAMEEILEMFANLPVKKLAYWLMEGVNALPEGVTLVDLIVDEYEYDEYLDNVLTPETLFDEETLAALKAKLCGEEEED